MAIPHVPCPDLKVIFHRQNTGTKKNSKDHCNKNLNSVNRNRANKTSGCEGWFNDASTTNQSGHHKVSKRFYCLYCANNFQHKRHLIQHIRKEKCNANGKTEVENMYGERSFTALKEDQLSHHGEVKSLQNSVKPTQEENWRDMEIEFLCEKERDASENLEAQINSKLEVEVTDEFEAEDELPVAYEWIGSLRDYRKVPPVRIFSCVQCGEKFHERQELNRHWNEHNDEGLLIEGDKSLPDMDRAKPNNKDVFDQNKKSSSIVPGRVSASSSNGTATFSVPSGNETDTFSVPSNNETASGRFSEPSANRAATGMVSTSSSKEIAFCRTSEQSEKASLSGRVRAPSGNDTPSFRTSAGASNDEGVRGRISISPSSFVKSSSFKKQVKGGKGSKTCIRKGKSSRVINHSKINSLEYLDLIPLKWLLEGDGEELALALQTETSVIDQWMRMKV